MYGNGYLTEFVKITKVADHTTAGTGDVTCTSVDMKDYDGVLILTSYGTAATNNILKVAQSTDDSSFAELASTAEIASGSSDEDVWVDIQRPQERYIKPVPERGTSSTLESVWCIQYKARSTPVDNTTTGTIAGIQAASPAEA